MILYGIVPDYPESCSKAVLIDINHSCSKCRPKHLSNKEDDHDQ